jgi:peptide/nickel transport system permease protein
VQADAVIETTLPAESSTDLPTGRPAVGVFTRVARYSAVRLVTIALAVVLAVYLTILIANMGGFVDTIVRSRIDGAIAGRVMGGWLRDVPTDEKFQIIEQTIAAMEEAAGLNEPFMLRCFRWLGQGLTLDWGESTSWLIHRGGARSSDARDVILYNLPRTLLLFGTANLFLFVTSILLALRLTRKHGSWLDRLVISLSPMSSAPAWAYGVLLNLVAIRVLGGLSTGGAFDSWSGEFSLAYFPILIKHMITPFLAIFLNGLFQSVYAWRSFFLVFTNEDHVEMAKARGLSARMIERRYILRPGLPNVLTSFSLLLIALWQEVIALEMFFNVQGVGKLFYTALRGFDMPIILGLVVTFAYLLAITVFLLDVVYALVDPRVRIGGESRTVRPAVAGGLRARLAKMRLRPSKRRKQATRGGAGGAKDPFRDLSPGQPRSAGYLAHGNPGRLRSALSGVTRGMRSAAGSLVTTLSEIALYPSAVLSLAFIVALMAASVATVIAIPYEEAVALWRGEERIWERNPAKAQPAWVNFFRMEDLPRSLEMSSHGIEETRVSAPVEGAGLVEAGVVTKSVNVVSDKMTEIVIAFPFDYPYGAFPQDLVVYVQSEYDKKKPLLIVDWLTPDGRELELTSTTMPSYFSWHLAQDEELQRELDGRQPQRAVFADPVSEEFEPLKGMYELRLTALVFEEGSDIDADFVLHGQVYGLAGTDHRRRDMMVALLWGMPVALAFGFLAALGTSLSTIVIAAVGTWHGGWVDNLLQRITEVNMILPFLPVSLMVYTLYSKSFWAILGVTVLLSIFGNAIKNYRAIFMQLKDSPYIEAAQAYGATDRRVIFRYLIPRISAILIPQLVILIPSYVFLEATLAFLGVSDPMMPTWGKLIVEAVTYGAHGGDYHLVLEPAVLLLTTGFAFAMVGLSLERVFEPRLREM